MLKSIGNCPNCGAPLFDKNKELVDIYGIVGEKNQIIDTKLIYHCKKCGAKPREQELK